MRRDGAAEGAAADRPDAVRSEWFDDAYWAREIPEVLALPDPCLCNLRITLAHYQLSLALRAVIGVGAGANFHTWAVWGSKKAGETIRREDARPVRRAADAAGGGLGLGTAALGAAAALAGLPLLAGLSIGLGCAVGLTPALTVRTALKRTARQILAGNRTVLDDIGSATGRFVAAFHARPRRPETDRLHAFLQTLRPGPTAEGGQDLLRRAFRYYDHARCETDTDSKHEWMLLANGCAILHEHIRLQPYIQSAMPRPLRRWITAHLLDFYLGKEALRVAKDVLPVTPGTVFPDTLRALENPDLLAFLEGPQGWDRTPGTVESSGAKDWSDLRDRMNFIVDLFRSRHLEPGLFAPPYSPEQVAALRSGRRPPGPL